MRQMITTNEFQEFYNSLSLRVQNKIDSAIQILSERKVISSKLVKKLVSTEFYELRISVGNEYRVILFTIDNDSFIEAEQVLLLNGFLKKSNKDYKKAIQKALNIIESMEE